MKNNKNIRFERIYIIVILLVAFWSVLEYRLYHLQISNHDYYKARSDKQVEREVPLKADRGSIFDRNGERLATNLERFNIGIRPDSVVNKEQLAKTFSSLFGRPKKYYMKKLNSGRKFTNLAFKVTENKLAELQKQQSLPFTVDASGRRFYPFGKYGSQILGFADVDDRGVSGLELMYDDILSGKDGQTVLQADVRRRLSYRADSKIVAPQPGGNLILTLDKNYQTIVEDELAKGVEKHNANYGIAVLMQPKTGQILAMASYPGFDANKPGASSTANRRNRAVTDVFEPGSTFKVFVAAALLQEKLKKPDDLVFCENGRYKFYDHYVHDSKKHAWLTFRKVVEYSSNIGMVKLVQDMPKNLFYRYIRNFGFASESGAHLPGETRGMLPHPDQFSGISKGVIAFGHEVGVNALQMVNGFCAVVNGGYLMRPYLVERITDADGELMQEFGPQRVRQVISPEVVETMKSFLVGAVEVGTGKNARIAGVKVGGKTGTAQKYDKKSKRYLNSYLSSFIGFAPAEDPELVLGVFLDEPHPRYYGGTVAAPIFKKSMERILNLGAGYEPESLPNLRQAESDQSIPDIRMLPVEAALQLLEEKQIDYSSEGDGSHIISQQGDHDELEVKLGDLKVKAKKMPDLRGLTLREALRNLDFSVLNVRVKGSGKVSRQSIKPGKSITASSTLLLTCAG